MKHEEVKRLAYKRLAMRAYYSRELADLLVEKGSTPEIALQVVDELTQLGYINDREWVQGTIRSLTARKYGPKTIAYKLASKGIPENEYEEFLEEVNQGQSEQIARLLATKYKNRNLSDFKERQKVIAAVMRKGFDLSEVIQALGRARAERCAEEC